jgi:hypothetical protein
MRRLTRHSEGGQLLESFVVSAIATVLLVRWALDLAGYPRLGGGNLHIAHLLWGGLLMLLAMLLVFLFLDRRVQYTAAVAGGIGFGLFIDEVGKFVTMDNDYFFRPAIALIYVAFVSLFILARVTLSPRLNRRESLANALDLLVDGVDGSIEEHTRHRIASLLDRSDPAHPLHGPLTQYALGLRDRHSVFDAVARIEKLPARLYERAAGNRWFERGLVLAVSAYAVSALVSATTLVLAASDGGFGSASSLAETGSSALGALLVVRGIVELPRSRPAAYHWFLRGLLVWLLVTQVFVFYSSQLAGIAGLIADLVAYVVLRFMIDREATRALGQVAR